MPFVDRLQELIDKRAGGNITAFAKACGLEPESVRRWTTEAANPTMNRLVAITSAYGVSLDWLCDTSDATNMANHPHINVDVVDVPIIDAEASAGIGALNGDVAASEEPEFLSLGMSMLRELGIARQNAQFIRIRGDSMEPTIKNGDWVLVDRGIDRVIDNGLYVLTWSGAVFIKRLHLRFDRTVVLKSDNPAYDDEIVPAADVDSLTVEGRVKWIGKTA